MKNRSIVKVHYMHTFVRSRTNDEVFFLKKKKSFKTSPLIPYTFSVHGGVVALT